MFVLAALLEGGLAFATSRNLVSPDIAGPLAKGGVLLLVGYGLWVNAHLRGLWFVMLGLLCNTLVIFANGGHMPVSALALQQAGMDSALDGLTHKADAIHSLMTPTSPLWVLGDIIPVKIWRYRNVISLGDIYLMIGVGLTLLEGSLRAKRKAEEPLDIDLRF